MTTKGMMLALMLGSLGLAGCGTCMRSVESPSTEGNCIDGASGEVCVQEVDGPNFSASTYMQGDDFLSTTVDIHLDWCGDAECSGGTRGRALLVVVDHQDGEQTVFTANCVTPEIDETVQNVAEISIQTAGNLSDANVACSGNSVIEGGFARWEICEPDLGAAQAPLDRAADQLARRAPAGTCLRARS